MLSTEQQTVCCIQKSFIGSNLLRSRTVRVGSTKNLAARIRLEELEDVRIGSNEKRADRI